MMKAEELRPIHDQVLVKLTPQAGVSRGGIILPDVHKDKQQQKGTAVKVGPGPLLRDGSRAAMQVLEGEGVICGVYAGAAIAIEGEEFRGQYRLVAETQILATFTIRKAAKEG